MPPQHRLRAFADDHPLLLATALACSLLAASLAFVQPWFRSNDDPSLVLYAAGVGIRTTPDEHLLFMHVAIGWTLKQLYGMARDFPWYTAFLYATFAAATVAMMRALALRHGSLFAAWSLVVLYVTVLINVVAGLQFTIVGFYCTAAGWALLSSA